MYKEERANYFFLFSVNGSPIPLAAQTKYLIVTFDSSLIHTSNLIHQQSLRTLPSIYIYIRNQLQLTPSTPAPQHPAHAPIISHLAPAGRGLLPASLPDCPHRLSHSLLGPQQPQILTPFLLRIPQCLPTTF